MRFLKSEKGFTFIELLVAMAIVGILGAAVAGLLKTGLSSYNHISSDMEYETEARTALSLITVQLRQHDETNAVAVTSGTCLTLKDTPSSATSSGTKIWYEDGYLYAQNYDNLSDVTSAGPASQIAEIAGLTIVPPNPGDDPIIYELTITYGASDNLHTLAQSITQRSAVPPPSPT